MVRVATPPHPYITLSGPAATVTVKAGQTAWTPVIPSTVQTVGRPLDEALTIPTGSDPIRMTGSVIINIGAPGTAYQVRALELLAGVQADGSMKAADTLTVEAAGQLLPFTGDGWLIESGPAWDAGTRRLDGAGNLVWVEGALTLVRQVDDRVVKSATAKARAAAAKKAAQRKRKRKRTHLVKRGETLSQIARDELGDGDRWQDIAKLNGIRDPRRLPVGKTLKLPQD